MLATSGEEALRRIEGGERFDLLLTDLMMPTMTGMQLYDRLERIAPELAQRALFLTGGAFSETARLFAERFAERLVEKPFDVPRLRELVRQRLAGDRPALRLVG